MPPAIEDLTQAIAQVAQVFSGVQKTVGEMVQTQVVIQKSITDVQQTVVALASEGKALS